MWSFSIRSWCPVTITLASHLNSKTSLFTLELQKIQKIKIYPSSSYKYPLTRVELISHTFPLICTLFSTLLHSTQCQTIRVLTCKLGVTFSTPLNSQLHKFPFPMSLSMHLHAIIDLMFHQHHALVLSFNHLLIHLCRHIIHHIHTCHIHPSTSGCYFNDCSSTISIPSTSGRWFNGRLSTFNIFIPSTFGISIPSTSTYSLWRWWPLGWRGKHLPNNPSSEKEKRKEMSGPVGMRKFC
jgi:hypothetical protein